MKLDRSTKDEYIEGDLDKLNDIDSDDDELGSNVYTRKSLGTRQESPAQQVTPAKERQEETENLLLK
ncbi:hypothetical protein J1N35_042656 [Gossypium stocksii]|uniref:Uncharacterized protein n=1 Tax=Gossypium stocksii TaxID=47602 RepID=A0A9D3U5Y1_9ROSI|nr:hypothetical protein J1N35_042656 [Gossypium stocksii]